MRKITNTLEEIRKLSPLCWLLLGISVLLFGYNTFQHGGYAVDDAYISFRFLDNWLNHEGLVFNPGEYVEGYTNFLWIILLAPLRLLGVPPEAAALVVNFVCVLAVAYACYQCVRQLSGGDLTASIGVWALLAGYGSFAFWLTAGMEPLLVTALLCWANTMVLRQGEINGKAALLYAAAVLTRPDALLFAIAAFAFYIPIKPFQNKSKFLAYLQNAAIFILPLIIHLIWRWSYYGEILPNTYFTKMHPDSSLMIRFGIAYFERFLWAGGVVLVAITIAGLVYKSLWSRFSLMVAAQIVVFCLYIIKVGGDYMLYFRFFIPLIPLLCILSAVTIAKSAAHRKQTALINSVSLTGLALVMTISLARSSEMEQAPGVRQAHVDNEIFSTWLSEALPKDTVIAMNLVGIVPYRTGFRTIDMLGLIDKHIAHGKVAVPRVGPGSYIGHFKYDGEYVCRRMPDVMVPTTIMLHPAPNAEQARISVINRSYDSDRDFWQSADCKQSYEAHYKELVPNKYAVIYINKTFLAKITAR